MAGRPEAGRVSVRGPIAVRLDDAPSPTHALDVFGREPRSRLPAVHGLPYARRRAD